MSKGSVKRWSAKRKQAVVLRLLGGESLDALSRETGQPAAVLSGWRDAFLEGGLADLKQRSEDPKVAALEKALRRAKRLVGKIREVLSEAEGLGFSGEGYRKVWARLRFKEIPTSKERVRRLMREHGLQAPHCPGSHPAHRTHDGTIIPDAQTGSGAPTPPR